MPFRYFVRFGNESITGNASVDSFQEFYQFYEFLAPRGVEGKSRVENRKTSTAMILVLAALDIFILSFSYLGP